MPNFKFMVSSWHVHDLHVAVNYFNHNLDFYIRSPSQSVARTVPYIFGQDLDQNCIFRYVSRRIARAQQLCESPANDRKA